MKTVFYIILTGALLTTFSASAFDIDFSRRQKKPAPSQTSESTDSSESVGNNQPTQPADTLPAPPPENVDGGHVVSAVDEPTESAPAPTESKVPSRLEGLFKHVVSPVSGDRQEFVILNTSKGFIPSNVRLRKGFHYTVHVVNVNEDKKNVSFMLDAFQQHHATYFGRIKSFNLDPAKEGIFEFQCPETAALGKIVVFGENLKVERHLSSEK